MGRKDLFVALEDDARLSGNKGSSPRTQDRAEAKEFPKFKEAKTALTNARQHHKFFDAKIRRVV